jgi:hypothetical protein
VSLVAAVPFVRQGDDRHKNIPKQSNLKTPCFVIAGLIGLAIAGVWPFFSRRFCLLRTSIFESSPMATVVVKVFSSVAYPDLGKPWTRQAPREVTGSGAVIEGKRILCGPPTKFSATMASAARAPRMCWRFGMPNRPS